MPIDYISGSLNERFGCSLLSSTALLISIIMPAYNSEAFIADTLESLILQDYGMFELLVVDDGSTDNTRLIVSAYAAEDSRLRLLQCEHKGAGAARNFGLEQAAGDYVVFVDADDLFESNYLSSLLELACSSAADVAVCRADCFVTNPAQPVRFWEARRYELPPGVYSCEDIASQLYQCLSLVVWNKLWKKDYLDCAQLRFQNLPRYNDAFFSIMALAQASCIAKTDTVLVHYRVGSGASLMDQSHLCPLCDIEALDAARIALSEKGLLVPALQKSLDSLCVGTITWRLAKFAQISEDATRDLYESYFGFYAQKWGLSSAHYPYINSPRYALENTLMRYAGLEGLLWAVQGDTRNRASDSNVRAELRFIKRLAQAALTNRKC